MAITIERYTHEKATEWNTFVAESKNGTFLFDRHYMDYHSDRFHDHSLIFRNEKGTIIALLPANEKEGTLYSHQGLTYGGLTMSGKNTASNICEIFTTLLEYLKGVGITKLIYKATPHIYHRIPSDEDLYALHNICHARLMSRSISSTIFMESPLPLRRDRRAAYKKACKNQLTVHESNDLQAFWNILEENLKTTHNATPVHTHEEMCMLKAAFPNSIRLFLASDSHGNPVGGILVYVMNHIVHTQYISASQEGKKTGAIDAIVNYLMDTFSEMRYFDFGTSTYEDGRILHESLISQKEGFGGRGVCHDIYEILI